MTTKNRFWAGVAVLLTTTAVVLLARRSRQDSAKDQPSPRAPQLPIQNPGEQSEFTTSASESEVG